MQCLPFEYYKAIEKADIFEKRFRTYSSTSEFSQNLWKKEETQRNVYLVCVIGHANFGMFNNSVYGRGLFVLLILFSRQCEKPTCGISICELPRFFIMPVSEVIINRRIWELHGTFLHDETYWYPN